MVKRYDADGCQSAIEHYVSWDDYERLKNEFMDYVYRNEVEKDKLINQLRALETKQ